MWQGIEEEKKKGIKANEEWGLTLRTNIPQLNKGCTASSICLNLFLNVEIWLWNGLKVLFDLLGCTANAIWIAMLY